MADVVVEVEVGDIIRKELQWHILNMLEPDYDIFESLENKAELFSALCKTLEFYSTCSEWEEFSEKLKGKELK